jgi:hypothetical protein
MLTRSSSFRPLSRSFADRLPAMSGGLGALSMAWVTVEASLPLGWHIGDNVGGRYRRDCKTVYTGSSPVVASIILTTNRL